MARNALISRAGGALRDVFRSARGLVFPQGSWGGYGGGASRQLIALSNALNGFFSGSNINYELELGDPSRSSLIMAMVNWLGDRLPEARLQVATTDDEDNDKPIPNHRLVQLLRRPNPYYSGATLMKHFAFSWVIGGNVYWWVLYDRRGRISQIWPLPHWLVWPRWTSPTSWVDFYEYQVDGESIKIPPISNRTADYTFGRIVHFQDLPDPENLRMGAPRIRSILRELVGDNEVANFSAALMKNSGVPPIVVSFKEAMAQVGKPEIKELQDDLQRRVVGDERGKLMVVSFPLEIKQLAWDPESIDLRKLRYISEERFCAVMGVPAQVLHLGAASETSTYNNVESALKDAARSYLVPLWTYMGEEITAQILSQEEFAGEGNLVAKHDLASVAALQEDQDKLADRVRKDVLAGLLMVHDAQAMRGWKPDPNCKYYLRPGNLVEVRDGVAIPPPAAQLAAQTQADRTQAQLESQERRETARAKVKAIYEGLPFLYMPAGIKALHEFSSTQVNITGLVAQAMDILASQIDPEDLHEKGIETESHITVRYGLELEDGEEIKELIREYRIPSLKAVLGETRFFAGDEFDVVYVSVKSPDIESLHGLLGTFPNQQTFSEFVPHATIAFVKPGRGPKYAGKRIFRVYEDDPALTDEVSTIVFNALIFTNKNRVQTVIPFHHQDDPVDSKASARDLIASEKSATSWLARMMPPDAQGIELPEHVE